MTESLFAEADASSRGDPLASLVSAATSDASALTELILAMQVDVWRVCAAVVDHDSADDLAQETFLRMVRALPSFRGESSVRTWVLSIARCTAMDHLRRLTRQRRLDSVLRRQRYPQYCSLESTLEAEDLLGELSADHRMAFVLTQMVGLSYSEAADVVGCPIGTIRSRVARARTVLVDLCS